MSIIEETQLCGTLLAIEEINDSGGILGREIVPIMYDPASDNGLYKRYAYKLLAEDGVTNIFGCYMSSSRKAVLPIIERMNGLLWYPTLYEGFEYSPNVLYTGASPNQNSVALCEYVLEIYGPRVYFIGSDYVYPRQSNRIMSSLLRRWGGEVVGESYVAVNAKRHDFPPVLRDIKALQPDVIFSTVVGQATVFLYQAYSDLGLSPRTMPIASLTTTEAEICAMTPEVGEGHITAAPYFQCVPGDRNASFVARYKARFGDDRPTNMCVEAAYFQVHMFARALECANCMDPDVLRPMVFGQTYDAPQGPVQVDRCSNHTNVWARIGRANRQGQFDVMRQSRKPVAADPYLMLRDIPMLA
jgi:branched-chain amino acid transport system substrate-binding protein